MSVSKAQMETQDNSKKQLYSLFLSLCQENDVEKVIYCIKLGVNVNTVSEDKKWSGLVIAAKNNFPEILEILLSQPGIDVNLKSDVKCSPLMFACAAGHHEIVWRLLQAPDIDTSHKDYWGNTALHWAARNGQCKCLQQLAQMPVKPGPGLDWNCKDLMGRTALFLAISRGHSDCAKFIVSQSQVEVDFSGNNDGMTLAEAAVSSKSENRAECIKILADVEGVKWSFFMKGGDTPIKRCLRNDQMEMFNILVKCPRVNVNSKDAAGDSLTMWALKNGKREAFNSLVYSTRVDLNMKNSSGDTLALYALKNDMIDMFHVLLQCSSVDLDIKDKNGDTAVLWALKNNKIEMLKELVPKVDVTITDKNGNNLEKIARSEVISKRESNTKQIIKLQF